MAQQTELEISRREVMGKAVKRLRKEGIIPANIFGHNEASMAIQLDAGAFERLRRSHGSRSVLTLRMSGTKSTQTALIRHVQREPHTSKIIHVDFFRVSLSERIRVKVPLHFTGEAPAVKTENGVMLHLLDAIEVECVARDIPEFLEVDVSGLTEIDAILHASDVKLPANFTLITDPEEGIVKVAATRAEVAEEAAEAAAASEAAPAAAQTPPAQGSTGE
ncbi:MAG TPA: 50S ribosomal protein L25 [Chthonomonadales bacterium]|nr:50S ribosomal protein L25 [Chthonomonadales bacterium]